MPSTRDIRRRIKSVKNTRQITKAMELVAASKMRKAQQAALAGRPYAQLITTMLAALAPHVEEDQHPFLVRREVKTRGILLITTDKGLCGPLNSNLFKLVAEIGDKTPAKFVTIGRKGAQYLARTQRNLIADVQVTDAVPFAQVRVAADLLIKAYLEGTVDTIEIIFSRFKNTLIQTAITLPVLPLDNLRTFVEKVRAEFLEKATEKERASVVSTNLDDPRDIIFEPSAQATLDALLPFYVNRIIYQHMLSAKASEHSARMVAMKTAKDNASKLLDDLTLKYNKARQTAITNEILEIAAAAAGN
ncbi:ATP synthase F1 subunit gamma [Geminisphaera colitermitum]|uniref:ATP synthase F1 subunit gamma n=1 Tax=Geminisphaera colitermitum TaxID=1148786 RepID=UPI000158CDEA|nr:ATP synthase F1 subunit gamma [Geminisphaera colitermitum]